MSVRKRLSSYSILDGDVVDGEFPDEEPRTERRAVPRSAIEVDVSVASAVQEVQGVTQNISCQGLFVSTPRMLPVGTQVSIKFALPGGTVMAKGVVSRLRQPSAGVTAGVALVFSGLEALDRSLIEAYCGEEQAPRTSDICVVRPKPDR